MRILRLFSLFLLSLPLSAWAAPLDLQRDLSSYFTGYQAAFVLYDARQDKYLRVNPELCRERAAPCSTFKIPNSLIALETGVATGPDFLIPWDRQTRKIEEWNQDQTLRSAFKVSCVWYYQEIARRIGQARMDEMLARFDYGNRDTSGGLDTFWLESTLKISADEQVAFLYRLQNRKLGVSEKALDQLLEIMTWPRKGNVIYRGKTGTGGSLQTMTATLGWWVGSLVTPDGEYYFATRLTEGPNPSSKEARKITEAILTDLGLLLPE